MLVSLLICGCLIGAASSSNVLAVFPHTGKSHFQAFEPLVQELAARGHNVTVISFYPQKTPLPNYTDISLVGIVPLRVSQVKFSQVEHPVLNIISLSRMALDLCEKILSHPLVIKLLESVAKFDLLIIEFFNSECFLNLAHVYKAPYVAISAANTMPQQDSRVGNPAHPAFVSNCDLPFSSNMNTYQRVVNVVFTAIVSVIRAYFLPLEQEIVTKLVSESVPSLQTIANNASILLVNAHHTMLRPRPLVPAYVEVGGLHIRPPKPLDKELDEYLTGSKDGVLLFSMGSVLQSSSFPEEKRQAFMDAFAELPVRVIMKWENDTLPGKPDNVRLSKWLPQRDILAHPKIVAFMGHGGFLSTSEAVHCGVPMVLIPMFGDQPNNVAHLEATGAAVKLSYSDITKDSVLRALRAILYDPRYRENAKSLSERFRDRPMSPLDTAVYWTEYVIRHKGAPHLRSAAVDMPWYQLWLLDVILALSCGLAALLLVVFWLAKRTTMLVSYLIYSPNKHSKTD